MNTHIYSGVVERVFYRVVAGWNSDLRTYYLTVSSLTGIREDVIYDSTGLDGSHCRDFAIFLQKLDFMRINLPQAMISEIVDDAVRQISNKKVYHSVINGVYKREVVMYGKESQGRALPANR